MGTQSDQVTQRCYLPWLDDEVLIQALKAVHSKYAESIKQVGLDDISRNVIDPFNALFESQLSQDFEIERWIREEAKRQIQKSVNMAIAGFHQTILGSIDGWEDLGNGHCTGLDLAKIDGSIFAELKNKFNTMNSSSMVSVFEKLRKAADREKQPICYLVDLIRDIKTPYNKPWRFESKKTKYQHPRVRRISGESFYELVAGRRQALDELFAILPQVVEDWIPVGDLVHEETIEIKAIDDLKAKLGGSITNETALAYFFEQAYPNRNSQA
jgi:hypothetical protein